MDERLIEIADKGHQDLGAFLFCAQILLKEIKGYKPHLTHILIRDSYAYATDGGTCRKARLADDYEEGMYRVFRKSKNEIILYLADLNHTAECPNVESIFNTENLDLLQQVQISENYWYGHAAIIQALNAKETFNAELLKGADGVYDLYLKDRMIILDNCEYALAMMPIETQQQLPGM